jgi:hypothetical protein
LLARVCVAGPRADKAEAAWTLVGSALGLAGEPSARSLSRLAAREINDIA